jgi:hypothetical protein
MPSQPRTISRSNSLRLNPVDAQETMAVGSGAAAPAARLDAEQIVEQRGHVVVVQVARAVAHDEGDDREPPGVVVAQDLDVRVRRPARDGPLDERLFALPDGPVADRLLELEDQPGADRLDDRRRAALLAHLGSSR